MNNKKAKKIRRHAFSYGATQAVYRKAKRDYVRKGALGQGPTYSIWPAKRKEGETYSDYKLRTRKSARNADARYANRFLGGIRKAVLPSASRTLIRAYRKWRDRIKKIAYASRKYNRQHA